MLIYSVRGTKNKKTMFRKLVSNLPYSPALITEVGFYARRLRNEDATRRVTVMFTVLALVMQSLALFSPPESANASSEQDIIRGGVNSLEDLLVRYDHNEDDIKDIYSTVGISRAEISSARYGTVHAKKNTYMMNRYGQLSTSEQEISMTYQRSAGGADVRYFSPAPTVGGTHQSLKGWVGESATLGWFAIIQSNGSVATRGIPASFDPAKTNTPGAVKLISAENFSQDQPAEAANAQPGDKIGLTLRLSNNHSTTITDSFTLRLSDIFEYAQIIDTGGGEVDQTNSTITWGTVQLRPSESQGRTFVIQVLNSIPATSMGTSNAESYDCQITASFGNAVTLPINCPAIKGVEAALYQMPKVDITGNLIFISIILAIVVFFWLRTRQLKKEIRIIRHNFNTGII